MDKLTARQEEYLLFFAARDEMESGVSEAAERFGVSKATVSVVCTALTKYKMIVKNANGSFALTDAGREYIGDKLRMARKVATCMTTRLGLQPYVAEMEARRLAVSLMPETVEAILHSWEQIRPTETEKADAPDLPEPVCAREEFFDGLEEGIYEIPFEVRKPDQDTLSMGNRGFLKPAELRHTEEGSVLYLCPARFSYKPIHRKLMDGSLERLWYQADGVWYESVLSQDGFYELPGSILHCVKKAEGEVGMIRIRARSTVGLRKMPESEADLVFLLENMSQKESNIK